MLVYIWAVFFSWYTCKKMYLYNSLFLDFVFMLSPNKFQIPNITYMPLLGLNRTSWQNQEFQIELHEDCLLVQFWNLLATNLREMWARRSLVQLLVATSRFGYAIYWTALQKMMSPLCTWKNLGCVLALPFCKTIIVNPGKVRSSCFWFFQCIQI